MTLRCIVSCRADLGVLHAELPPVTVDVSPLETASAPISVSSAFEIDPAQYDYVTSLSCKVAALTTDDVFINNQLLEPRFLAFGADGSHEVFDATSVAETYPLGIVDTEKAAQVQAIIEAAPAEEGILAGVGPEVFLFEPAASVEE